ncbi:mitochondrial import receptor subunit Tom22 [Coemansia sp. RSA 1365]|nr:mitochondrial import receptor subunit Tom22 [Coemansia sp. RSA 1365]
MVKLVEIEDESVYDDDSQYTTDAESESVDSLSEKEYEDDSDFDDDDILDESLLERLVALKEIVPASQRHAISRTASTIGYWGNFGARLVGKLGWVLTTSALLVVFPLALETDREKMMQQWESEQQNLQQNGGAPGQGQMMPPPGLGGPAVGPAGVPVEAPGLV